MEYKIKCVKPSWEGMGSRADIGCYPWGREYCPQTWASVTYIEDTGFHVHMVCMEKDPRAEYKNNNDPVYQDSCMEFFVNFAPDKTNQYLNFEVNSNGAMLCGFGEKRGDRTPVEQMGIQMPRVLADKKEDCWEISYNISMDLIKELYGVCKFEPGYVIKGNFYKCGDKTNKPHYGCWNSIEAPKPDFHQPGFFGRMILD